MFFLKHNPPSRKPFLEQIIVYPIKSLDGISVPSIEITKGGSLKHDRQFMIVDEMDTIVNAKRFPLIHKIRAKYNEEISTVTLLTENKKQEEFELSNIKGIEIWLSEYFKLQVSLKQNLETGFPDDLNSPGPTIVSTATFAIICDWYKGQFNFSVSESIHRFRPNLLIGGAPPFFEDQFIGDAILYVGELSIRGINSCQRCVVPSRNSETGEVLPSFAKIFSEKRKETLPSWANVNHFNHFYKLCLNTKISDNESGKEINVGDAVSSESDQWGDII